MKYYIILISVIVILIGFIIGYFIYQEKYKKELINKTDQYIKDSDDRIKSLQKKYDDLKGKNNYSVNDINKADLETARKIALALRQDKATLFDLLDQSFNQMNSDSSKIKTLNTELKLSTIRNGFGAYIFVSFEDNYKVVANVGLEYKHYFLNNHFYLGVGAGVKTSSPYLPNIMAELGGNF